jgi:hypothetical protein
VPDGRFADEAKALGRTAFQGASAMTKLGTIQSPTRIVWGLIAVSALLLAAQVWIIGQWVVAASGGRATAVSDFQAALPGPLRELGAGGVTWLCVVLAVMAASAAFVAQSNALGTRRLFPRGLLAANGLLLAWYLFTMM